MAMEARVATINVALPGRVDSYNATTQRADVTPLIKRAVRTPDEDYLYEDLPQIPNVRVIHPGGEDWALHVPIKQGDTVQLIFQQWDPAEWMRTGEVSAPADKRRFSLAYATAIPGFRAADQTIPGAVSDAITLSHKNGFVVKVTNSRVEVGGNSDSASRASLTDDQLNDLKTAINGWTPVPNDGGAALKVALTTWLADVANTGSTKLKVGG